MRLYIYCEVTDAQNPIDITPNVDILRPKNQLGMDYCMPTPNSTGLPAQMSVWGNPLVGANDLWLPAPGRDVRPRPQRREQPDL